MDVLIPGSREVSGCNATFTERILRERELGACHGRLVPKPFS
jgi:hypothetical protein